MVNQYPWKSSRSFHHLQRNDVPVMNLHKKKQTCLLHASSWWLCSGAILLCPIVVILSLQHRGSWPCVHRWIRFLRLSSWWGAENKEIRWKADEYNHVWTPCQLSASAWTVDPSSPSVVFLKTHKTGSSTIAGIFWRQLCGVERQHCFLPPQDHPGRTFNPLEAKHWQYMTQPEATDASTGPPYAVWLSHVKFHPKLWQLMKPPVLTMTVARHPGQRFQSAWYWYDIPASYASWAMGNVSLSQIVSDMKRFMVDTKSNNAYSRNNGNTMKPMHDDSDHAEHYSQYFMVQISSQPNLKDQYPYLYRLFYQFPLSGVGKYRSGLNSMSQELLGLDLIISPSKANYWQAYETQFLHLLQAMANKKLFVMVLERMEESLLVYHRLKYGLNSPFQLTDLSKYVFLKQKVQSYDSLSQEDLEILSQFQSYDRRLYDKSNVMLDEWLALIYGSNANVVVSKTSIGPKPKQQEEDVQLMQSFNQKVEKICKEETIAKELTLLRGEEKVSLVVNCSMLQRDNREIVQHVYLSLKI